KSITAKIDKKNPKISISKKEIKDDHITLKIEATDDKSGIKRVKKPNGKWTSQNSFTYKVTENGTYEFIAEDKAGNRKSESITVHEIKNAEIKHVPSWQEKIKDLGLDDNTFIAG